MSYDTSYLICATLGGDSEIIHGSVLGSCADCGVAVWLAPTGQAMLAEEGAVSVCMPCGLALIARDEAPQIDPPTPAQLDELARHQEHRP